MGASQVPVLIEKVTKLYDRFMTQGKTWDALAKKGATSFSQWRRSNTVSFSANKFLWSDDPKKFQTYPNNLIATNVESNRGRAYSNKTGFFTAPSDGSYMFMATVFASTFNGRHKNGAKTGNHRKWRDDMIFYITRYNAGVTPDRKGDVIAQLWLGEQHGSANYKYRKSASAQAIHYLKKGEKIVLEWRTWNSAKPGDKVMLSFNFSGAKLH